MKGFQSGCCFCQCNICYVSLALCQTLVQCKLVNTCVLKIYRKSSRKLISINCNIHLQILKLTKIFIPHLVTFLQHKLHSKYFCTFPSDEAWQATHKHKLTAEVSKTRHGGRTWSLYFSPLRGLQSLEQLYL